jgi:hypothetical protein
MARSARLAIVLASVISSQLSVPSESHAGVIPWMYDAIFGPVGSMRPTYGYGPATASYGPMMANYAPYGAMTAAYVPSATSYVQPASYSSYGNSCSSCSQQANYGMSGCSSCGSGNCSAGSSCSSCSSSSTTAGYGSSAVGGPTPDPSAVSREESLKIYELERKLEELDHRQKQDENFLKRHHQEYNPEQFTPRTYQDVPARPKKMTLESGTANPNNFEPPINRGPAPGFDLKETEEERRKPTIELPPKSDPKSDGTDGKGTTNVKEVEPMASQRDYQVTARAVAPRVRMQIVTNKSTNAIARLNKKKPLTTSNESQSQSVQLAKQAN